MQSRVNSLEEQVELLHSGKEKAWHDRQMMEMQLEHLRSVNLSLQHQLAEPASQGEHRKISHLGLEMGGAKETCILYHWLSKGQVYCYMLWHIEILLQVAVTICRIVSFSDAWEIQMSTCLFFCRSLYIFLEDQTVEKNLIIFQFEAILLLIHS